MNSSKIAVIVVAAGEGSRLPGECPKAYRLLAGESFLIRCINSFVEFIDNKDIIVVFSSEHEAWLQGVRARFPELRFVAGGATRQASVKNALQAIENEGYSHVLIHDAARPLVEAVTIQSVIAGLKAHAAVIPAIPVVDTIKRLTNNGTVAETLPRNELCAVQTPQGFEYPLIHDLHQRFADREATDDAMLAEWAGVLVHAVAGSRQNFKITTPEDILMAEFILFAQPYEIRTGIGFDVHQLVAGDAGSIKLCGVDVPCDAYLEGHSDGDVGLHAITDAIFGALAAGDLGEHFSSDDVRWKDADSSKFLIYSNNLLRESKAIVQNIDLNIIAQKPRVSPYREAMRQRIAEILQIDQSRVSVKATTTDHLGFTGRGEGIAAQAIVTICKK